MQLLQRVGKAVQAVPVPSFNWEELEKNTRATAVAAAPFDARAKFLRQLAQAAAGQLLLPGR